MSRNESRTERKKENKNLQEKSKASLNKVYYWVIGFLFLILFLLVLFIFSKSSDKVDLTDDQQQQEQIENGAEVNQATEENSTDQETEANETTEVADPDENQETDETDETDDEDAAEDDAEDNEENTVNEDAPLDTDYAVDYNDGSADRIAIKNKIIGATGLDNDLIEYWVGNNGPGRVIATVASSDQSDIYEVELQYGEGEWHVTSYRSLDSIPENFN